MALLQPFDSTGVRRDESGVSRYAELPGSVVEMLRSSVDRFPDQEAVVELNGPRVSFQQLWDSCARVAGGLREAGVAAGERVAIRHGNGLDWVRGFFGTLMAGGVAVPVNTRLADPEVEYVVADCGARVVLTPEAPLPEGNPYVAENIALDDVAAIFYTSGTTGLPKGAMTTHENFLTTVENGIRVAELPRADPQLRNLVSIPLYHVTGCNNQLLPSMQEGGATVIMPSFDVHRFLRAIVDERIRVITSSPAVFWYALSRPDIGDFDLSRVSWVTYGGAPIAPALVRRIKNGFPNARVGNGYGLTETSSVATFLPDEWTYSHTESVGFAVPTVDLDLDLNGNADLGVTGDATARVGELLIRGGNVVSGYWGKPEATTVAFSDGCWLRTGDLARIDCEGRVYIVDRIKDMINRGGENVYSIEVECVLANAPGVFEVAVLGVADEMMGEKVGVVVVPMPGQSFDQGAMLDFARERLADFKVPQHVLVQDEPLPRNPGGKVLKALLRQRAGWDRADREEN